MNPACTTRNRTIRLAALWLTISVVAAGGAAQPADSLARHVPAEVGLFVELRQCDQLLADLTEPQLWTTLAELAGQPARPEDVTRWRSRIRNTVRMEPEQAIRVLFAGGVAFIGEGPGRAQDAVVVCRPGPDVRIDELLEKWQAVRLPERGEPPTYRLLSNIGVIHHDGLLYFGDLLPAEGLLRRVARFIRDGQRAPLADDPAYRALLGRAAPRPVGVVFARMASAAPLLVPNVTASTRPATQPVRSGRLPDLPGPLHHARNILISLHRDRTLLHFSLLGDGRDAHAAAGTGLEYLPRLPLRTLLAWEGHLDYRRLPEALTAVSGREGWAAVLQLDQQDELLGQLVAALGTDTCVAIGPVFPARRPADAPPLPAAAALVAVRDSGQARAALREIAELCIAGYAVFALANGAPPLTGVEQRRVAGHDAWLIDLTPLLKQTARQAIGELHLCWAVTDDTLVVASHLQWLERLLAARSGHGRLLAQTLAIAPARPGPQSTAGLVVQTGPIADMGQAWLDHLRRIKPEVFDERYWRDHQPYGRQPMLGINVTVDAAHRRLRINQVFKGQPAEGRLRVGDYIVGHDNRRFATDDMISEIRAAIRNRPHARWMELLIERNGVTLRKRIPLPLFNPIEMLQRVVAMGHLAQRSVYFDDHPNPGAVGYLTIELRRAGEKLFELRPPASPAPSP